MKPEATEWRFPPVNDLPPDEDLVAGGADLEPGTLLAAYSSGFFPMPVGRRQLGWFHPNPRGVLPLDGLRISRSLRRSVKRYEVTVDAAFDDVIAACADPSRPLGWIDKRVRQAYTRLHYMGWAHSIETWDDDGLAGGLYGVSIGGLFAGESMFHRRTDASKVALVHLVDLLREHAGAATDEQRLLDVQWVTPHLASLGAIEVSRRAYHAALGIAVHAPRPSGFERLPAVPEVRRTPNR
jgi:leucyl/phenylalanyl-tRNA--protein transferase